MHIRRPYILTINAGSSSIKFALYSVGASKTPMTVFEGAVSSIGWGSAQLAVTETATKKVTDKLVDAHDFVTASKVVVKWLSSHVPSEELLAVGHRIVHGGPYYHEATLITDDVIETLRTVIKFDPLHLPNELALIETFAKEFAGVSQVACFDTSFHYNLPQRAKLLPIPRKYYSQGIRRYGFHGLSCEFIVNKLEEVAGPEVASGRLIIAHLGNGVSLTAVKDGKSIDTTMGLTPSAGVPMSTRSGDIDPGIVRYLANSEGTTASEFETMTTTQSGLLGMSETTADMEKLLEQEAEDERAKDAVDVFCYSIKKSIGALAAALGGLDMLIFTGGMGENAPKIRAKVCKEMDVLGISIDPLRNTRSAAVISRNNARVTVRVMHTDESLTIVRETQTVIKKENYETDK